MARPGEAAPGSVDGPGQLEPEGDRATVRFQRLLHHPIEEVWSAITDPEQLAIWYSVKVTHDPMTGRLDLRHATGVHSSGRVLTWQPPRVYEYEWQVPAGPSIPEGEDSVVRFELAPVPDGTLLVLTHRKLTRRTAEVFARGLQTFLDRLVAHLDGTPLPTSPWLARALASENVDLRS